MRLTLAALILTLGFFSCKKYEEGPAVSFRSKTKRLEGSWQLVKWTVDGTEQDLSQTTWRLNIHRSGNYDKFITYNIPPLPTTIDSENGSWDFNKNKSHVEFTDQATEATLSHEIVRLHNNELWLRYSDGTVTEDYQYNIVK